MNIRKMKRLMHIFAPLEQVVFEGIIQVRLLSLFTSPLIHNLHLNDVSQLTFPLYITNIITH